MNTDNADREDKSREKDKDKGLGDMRDYGSITSHGGRGVIQIMSIIGQIEGHTELGGSTKSTKYEHILPQLVAIEESQRVEGLLILLNTVGGDVEAGLAIAEVIASMRKPTVSLVLGGGHSIGVPLTVSAKRSFIVPSATMTIHPVRYNGLIVSAPQTYHYLDKIEDRIVSFVVHHSKISERRLTELMKNVGELVTDIGSVLDGENAVREGIVDSLGGVSEALDALYEQMDK
ncbi:Translocation-enhancing protein TepA [bioreactor metagenome]|uniref:Translocation-enhancing protein TepA n=1 Tax=bioreactor metagenome TaxID=1076179 RepID=A0A645BUS0_9ZZZZ